MSKPMLSFRRLSALSLVAVSTAALVACGGGGGAPSDASTLLMAGPPETNVNSNAPIPGAIWTSEATCTGVNLNIYLEREAVYLNGGPQQNPNAASLPANTSFYVQVTAPDGQLLGSSVGTANETPFVTNALGRVSSCLQLWTLVKQPNGDAGYAETPNNGGEYKVWISTAADFKNSLSKTDNFKVKKSEPPLPEQGEITVSKWYDANTNGLWDEGEQELAGWNVDVTLQAVAPTKATYGNLPLHDHVAREFAPVQQNWLATNAFLGAAPGTLSAMISENAAVLNAINVPLAAANPQQAVSFGNVCVGAGGGLTKGFWGNKNGEAAFTRVIGTTTALAALQALNLRNEDGSNFDPAAYKPFNAWLQDSRAVNMAFMLSAQLAAMQLNVLNGNVSGGALVHAPGALGANAAGFMSVSALISEANAALGAVAVTRAGVPQRSYQEWLKNALDAANNNRNFAQAAPCAYSFPTVAPVAPVAATETIAPTETVVPQ